MAVGGHGLRRPAGDYQYQVRCCRADRGRRQSFVRDALDIAGLQAMRLLCNQARAQEMVAAARLLAELLRLDRMAQELNALYRRSVPTAGDARQRIAPHSTATGKKLRRSQPFAPARCSSVTRNALAPHAISTPPASAASISPVGPAIGDACRPQFQRLTVQCSERTGKRVVTTDRARQPGSRPAPVQPRSSLVSLAA